MQVHSLIVSLHVYFLAQLSTKCSWWAIVIGQCPSCGVNILLIKPTPPTPLGHLTRNLVGSIGMTCRSKTDKIVLIRNPRWPPCHLENLFRFFSWTIWPIDFKLGRKHRGDDGKSKMSTMSAILKLFFASSPVPKGQLTWNLVVSIGMTCRLKMTKIILIRNPRWPPCWPSWKSIFCFYSWA